MGYAFNHLKTLVETGVNQADKIPKYENVNYALARVLMAYVDGYVETQPFDNALISGYFTSYLNNEIFKPIDITNVDSMSLS